jgi:DNA-binding NtrC family response regulator
VILVTAHGDYDRAIDALRGGAMDYLRKPVDVEQLLDAIGRAQKNLARSRARVAPPTVLVIDDEEKVRTALNRVLSKEKYQVLNAADGEQGMRLFLESEIDVVLLDLRMPGKGGLEVLQEIRKVTDDVEAIIITGYGDEEAAVHAMRAGAADYLRKPVDIEELLGAVSQALARRTVRRCLARRSRDVAACRELIAKISETSAARSSPT